MFSFTKKIEQLATFYDEPKDDLKHEVRRLQRLLQLCQLSESFDSTSQMSNEGNREPDVESGTVRAQFSKPELVKTYLRSQISQSRLSSLVMLSIKRELTEKLSLVYINKDFASCKSSKRS